MIDALAQDIKHALRHLRRSPAFTLAATTSLAFGIGANAAIFSVLNAIALRDLPVRDPSRLIAISTVNSHNQLTLTPPAIVGLLERDPGPLQDVCAYNGGGVLAAEANGRPSQMLIELMSARCLQMFGVTPVVGRLFTDDEAPQSTPGAAVTVIGHRYWQRMFDGDANAVGKTVKLDGRELTILGVLPAGFPSLQLDAGADVLAPFGAVAVSIPGRLPRLAYVIGRLREGVSFDTARAEIVARWPALFSSVQPIDLPAAERAELPDLRARVQPIGKGFSTLRARYEQPFAVVLGLTGMLLVLVCANLGGLILARISERSAEFALRAALGSSPFRLTRQVVAESIVVVAAAITVAIPLAWALTGVLSSLLPVGLLPRAVSLTPDARVLTLTAAAGFAAAALLGIAPVRFARRHGVASSVQWGRTVAGGSRHLSAGLLVMQIALSVVLLFGAALLARTLAGLWSAETGLRSAGVLTVRLMPLPGAYRGIDNATYYPELIRRLLAVPSVSSVGFARAFSHITDETTGLQQINALSDPNAARGVRGMVDTASPELFPTVGIPLLRGRLPDWSDTPSSPSVAVVSENLAYALFASRDPIGQRIRAGTVPGRQEMEIVGVVGNTSLGGLRSSVVHVVYRPILQEGLYANYPTFQIRTNGNPLAVVDEVRQAVQSMGREYVHSAALLDEMLARSPARERLAGTLAVAVAALAVLLTFIGVFGRLMYAVSQRTREIGVRVAVGATSGDVLRMVVRDAVILTAVGLAIGIPAALGSSRVIAFLLYGVTPFDLPTLVMTALFFGLLGATAGLIPARRAARVDPVIALRAE